MQSETIKIINSVTDAELDKIAELMPDSIQGFCKTWGYRQYSRALLELVKKSRRS